MPDAAGRQSQGRTGEAGSGSGGGAGHYKRSPRLVGGGGQHIACFSSVVVCGRVGLRMKRVTMVVRSSRPGGAHDAARDASSVFFPVDA